MTQYTGIVDRQRAIIEAEEWGKQVKWLHIHSLNIFLYDTRHEHTADGKRVWDTMYNSGLIKRVLDERDGGRTVFFGRAKKGTALFDSWRRNT